AISGFESLDQFTRCRSLNAIEVELVVEARREQSALRRRVSVGVGGEGMNVRDQLLDVGRIGVGALECQGTIGKRIGVGDELQERIRLQGSIGKRRRVGQQK